MDEFILQVAFYLATLRFWKIAGNPNKNKQEVVRADKTEVIKSLLCGLDPLKHGIVCQVLIHN